MRPFLWQWLTPGSYFETIFILIQSLAGYVLRLPESKSWFFLVTENKKYELFDIKHAAIYSKVIIL